MIKASPFIGVITGVTAFSAVAFVMLSNSSRYVSISEARKTTENNLHLKGNLVKESLQVDVSNAIINFTIKDENGDAMNVVHHGLPPANMGEATEVVAVGGMVGDHFESNKLLTKCPSKYNEEQKRTLPAN
jgi:cytochrome c-type biogenesis protein CcmE